MTGKINTAFEDERRRAIVARSDGTIVPYEGLRTVRAAHHKVTYAKNRGRPIMVLYYDGRSKFGHRYIDVVTHRVWYHKGDPSEIEVGTAGRLTDSRGIPNQP